MDLIYSPERFLEARLDEFKIYHRALSDAVIQELYLDQTCRCDLHTDDFESADSSAYTLSKWGYHQNTVSWTFVEDNGSTVWQNAGGSPSGNGGGSVQLVSDQNLSDVSVEAIVKLTDLDGITHIGTAGVTARFQNNVGGYFLAIRKGGHIMLHKHDFSLGMGGGQPTPTTLGIVNDVVTIGEWYTLKMVVSENRIQGYLDDEKMFDVIDDSFTTGYVGVWGTGVEHFDDLCIGTPEIVDTDGDGVPDDEDVCQESGADGPCGPEMRDDGCPVNDVDGDDICNDDDMCQWTGDGVYGIKYEANNIGCAMGDADDDKIADDYDSCAWSGDNGLGVKSNGCPASDSDGDDVPGRFDKCATQSSYPIGINNKGCAVKDPDGDGMPNPYDKCAWQAIGSTVYMDVKGCRKSWTGLEDPDGDRIPTEYPAGTPYDQCPNEGSMGFGIFADGCPIIDTDGDLVPDQYDACPGEGPEDRFGITADGCPILDSDNDSMPDDEDACPDEGPTEEFGMTSDGCPIYDSDGDTVPDTEDQCPDIPGIRMNIGC